MAYTFRLEGTYSANLPQESVTAFTARTETPRTNDGRGVDTAVTMTMSGPIRSVDENAITDETLNLARWATEYDDGKAYSQATSTAVASGQVLRRDVYPEAFVVCYKEKFNVSSGVGTYEITLRQKKDLIDNVQTTGGYLG